MKILTIHNQWIGGLFKQLAAGIKENGHEVISTSIITKKHFLKALYLNHFVEIQTYIKKKELEVSNNEIFEECKRTNPDLIFVMNESGLSTQNIELIKDKIKCKLAVWIADNPFDSSRFTYLPLSLKYFDYIFVSDRSWIPAIKNVAIRSQVIKITSGGGFDPELFFAETDDYDKDLSLHKFRCNIAFTGESYELKAEGAYRARILEQLSNYGLKIWGDEGWKRRFRFHHNLENAYQGGRLAYSQLRKLYKTTLININMPAPQIISGFQPRVFEIAACKGFQIVDWREELDELFLETELVTFKDVSDLLEKIDYFIKYPEKRIPYINNMYTKVWNNYSWKNTSKSILDCIKI